MNLDDLTLGDLKEIKALLGGNASPGPTPHPWTGKYVIVRSHLSGVWGGVLQSVAGEVVTLSEAKRLWSWTVAGGVACSGLAAIGLKSGKVDAVVPQVAINGWIEIIPTSAAAEASIRGAA